MRDWIAGIMAVLGTLLVLAGAAIIVLRAMGPGPGPGTGADRPDAAETASAKPGTRLVRAVRDMPAADRLIGWGIVLLVLGAVAAGAISFSFGANAGTR